MALPTVRQMMQRLLAQPSVSCVQPALDMPNRPLIEELAGWLESAGFAVEVMALPAQAGKANLLARAGPTTGTHGRGLLLAGHTDTVPCDEARWHYDPFALTEDDGRCYGLGSCDMKLFLAFALGAAQRFDLTQLTHPLSILATADEESTMAGARALAASGQRLAEFAVIGEPTGLRPVRAHKGVLAERIRVRGRAGHASDPALGANALEGMHSVIGELLRLRGDLAARHRDPAFGVPVPTLNLGRIEGGDNPNRICAECVLDVDLRTLPGMSQVAVREELRRRLGTCLAGSGLALEVHPLGAALPAMETPAAATIVRAAEALTGHGAGTAGFGTEAPYLQQLDAEVVVLGPGDVAQAHQADEFLPAERIEPTIDLLARLIGRFCTQ